MSDLQDTISTFTKRLTTEWKRKYTPRGFQSALTKAYKSPPETIERILVDAGVQAWLSYFLAQVREKQHYSGKHADIQAIAFLKQSSVEIQQEIASKLSAVKAHPTVSDAIEKLISRASESKSTSQPPSAEEITMLPPSQMRSSPISTLQPHQAETSMNIDPNSAAAVQYAGVLGTITQPPFMSDVSFELIGTSDSTASNPPTKKLPDIFPSYLCSAIRKAGDRAALSMAFPSAFSSYGAVCMSLTILSHKIEHMAMQLFGVHIEEENGSRYILLGHGARLNLRTEIVMQGASAEDIVRYIGSELSHAIDVCPARKEEVTQAITLTRCVTMQISSNAREDGILNLWIEESKAYQIKQKLFE